MFRYDIHHSERGAHLKIVGSVEVEGEVELPLNTLTEQQIAEEFAILQEEVLQTMKKQIESEASESWQKQPLNATIVEKSIKLLKG